MKPSNELFLRLIKLSTGYPAGRENHVLIGNIDIELKGGGMVAIIGNNGTGKTTLLKTLAGYLKPLHGEIYIGDVRVSPSNRPELARYRAMVLANQPVQLSMNVYELVKTGRYPYVGWYRAYSKADEDRVACAIEEVGAAGFALKKMFELSDGQRQLAFIARALAQETPLILLDEPTAHLDLHNQLRIFMLLKRLANKGKRILLTTHHLEMALQLADDLWVINGERRLIHGLPEDIVLKGVINKTFDDDNMHFNPATNSFEFTYTAGHHKCPVAVRGNGLAAQLLIRALKRAGYQVVAHKGALPCITVDSNGHYHLQYLGYTAKLNSIKSVIDRLPELTNR